MPKFGSRLPQIGPTWVKLRPTSAKFGASSTDTSHIWWKLGQKHRFGPISAAFGQTRPHVSRGFDQIWRPTSPDLGKHIDPFAQLWSEVDRGWCEFDRCVGRTSAKFDLDSATPDSTEFGGRIWRREFGQTSATSGGRARQCRSGDVADSGCVRGPTPAQTWSMVRSSLRHRFFRPGLSAGR